jgi:glycosyltransferase involved in cell wall biosynthesis
MATASVIIPTYNNARFVAQAVESALMQSSVPAEIIVVDDGSTDGTQDVLAGYNDRITVIRQKNRGPAAARNHGYAVSSGDYLLFLDSDDLVPPNKLEIQISFLETHPEFGLVYSAWRQIDESGTRVLGEVRPNKQGHLLRDILCRRLFFFPGTAVIRRECLEQVGPFDESLFGCEDADLWLRLAHAGYAFGYVDVPLFSYRVHSASITGTVNPRHVRSWVASLDKFFHTPDLPDEVRALEDRAYSILHYETAARHYRAGQIELGQDQIRQAMARCPEMNGDRQWLLEWIAGSALDPRTRDPLQFIDTLFDHCPPEATHLRPLRRRAYGRYHASAAFTAHQNRHFGQVLHHVLPALAGDPTIVRNRGFLRIVAESAMDHLTHCH